MLRALSGERVALHWGAQWTRATTERVASGLLRIASDFGLLTGGVYKEFASYHLPDESFVYLLHAMKAIEHNARRVIASPDWRLNVAVSRAQCLAYVACPPRLLEVDCRTVEHLKLANALCLFAEQATSWALPVGAT